MRHHPPNRNVAQEMMFQAHSAAVAPCLPGNPNQEVCQLVLYQEEEECQHAHPDRSQLVETVVPLGIAASSFMEQDRETALSFVSTTTSGGLEGSGTAGWRDASDDYQREGVGGGTTLLMPHSTSLSGDRRSSPSATFGVVVPSTSDLNTSDNAFDCSGRAPHLLSPRSPNVAPSMLPVAHNASHESLSLRTPEEVEAMRSDSTDMHPMPSWTPPQKAQCTRRRHRPSSFPKTKLIA